MERSYRLGPFVRGKPWSIFVTFENFNGVQLIISRARRLKGSYYSINKDFSARKTLWSTFKSIKQRYPDSRTVLAYPAKVIRDGDVVLDRFPDWDDVMNHSNISKQKTADSLSRTRSNTQDKENESMNSHVTRTNADSARDLHADRRAGAYQRIRQVSTSTSRNTGRNRRVNFIQQENPYITAFTSRASRRESQHYHSNSQIDKFSRPWLSSTPVNRITVIRTDWGILPERFVMILILSFVVWCKWF
jgi:hypothetical protein